MSEWRKRPISFIATSATLRHGRRRLPPHETIERIAQACDVNPRYFRGYREMEKLAVSFAGGQEPTESHWDAARMVVLVREARGYSGE